MRLPKALHAELERIVKENHFMDLSEEMRFILRRKWIEHNPEVVLRGGRR